MSKTSHLNRLSKAHERKENSIHRDNLSALKAAELRGDTVRKTVFQLLCDISAAMANLWAPKRAKVNSMCKYYGHVIDRSQWKDYLPKCADCGSEISDSSQLRKSQVAAKY